MAEETQATGPTRAMTFRFTDDDVEAIDALRQHHGIGTRADLLRFLVRKERAATTLAKKPKKST